MVGTPQTFFSFSLSVQVEERQGEEGAGEWQKAGLIDLALGRAKGGSQQNTDDAGLSL